VLTVPCTMRLLKEGLDRKSTGVNGSYSRFCTLTPTSELGQAAAACCSLVYLLTRHILVSCCFNREGVAHVMHLLLASKMLVASGTT